MENLLNTNILELMPYKAGKPIEEIRRNFGLNKIVKLASNENPSEVPENVKKAITNELKNISTYPDSDSFYLKKKIAENNNVGFKNVLVGAGSVEIIRMIVKAFLKPGERVLTSEKTFIMYKIAAIENSGKESFLEAEMDGQFRFDLNKIYGMIDEKVKIIFITNPNNPTGTLLPKKEIENFIKKVPENIIIVLDNAYEEYVEDQEKYFSGIDMINKKKNLIILRTFSKIYGLAGLRIGYALGGEDVISYMGRVKAPFNVTRIAQQAAISSLENDEFKISSREINIRNRKKLYNELKKMGVNVIPSETNFLMFFPDSDIKELNDKLLREGVIIRPLRAFGVPDGMRVTVGFEEDNNFFIEKLKKVLGK